MNFKDHFSSSPKNYKTFRPDYPRELFVHLASLCKNHDTAWDCATGSGQAADSLAEFFTRTIATDASARQITNTIKNNGVTYRIASAEDSGLPDNSADLVTVAQALHWFDLDSFAKEVKRVLKPNGILAVWTYNLLQINQRIDEITRYLYSDLLSSFWPPERLLVESGYSTIRMPLEALDCPTFRMHAQWNLGHLIGYLNTWSAVRAYENEIRQNPVGLIEAELADAWEEYERIRTVNWPLSIRLWRNST